MSTTTNSHLHQQVQEHFIELADLARLQKITVLDNHLKILKLYQHEFAQVFCNATCLFCLATVSRYTLDCGHALCRPCVSLLGSRTYVGTGTHIITQCPICNQQNDRQFTLAPSTAGPRVLRLAGPVSEKGVVAQFLKDLQRRAGLTGTPVTSQFDRVEGLEIGKA